MDIFKTLNDVCAFKSVSQHTNDPQAPFGPEVNKALLYVLDLCESFGFRTKNCDNMIGWAEIGEGEDLFGILVHLDVVPAGNGWDYEPFAATVDRDLIYGRGVTDDKGPAVASIYAMKDLLDSKAPLKKRIRIIFGQTEEGGGWTDMAHYKETQEIPSMGFTPDADFPAIYGEKGITGFILSMPKNASGISDGAGGQAANMVPDAAWAKVGEQEYRATGVSAHGSKPEDGRNAISILMAGIAEKEPECAFAKFYCDCIGFDVNGGLLGIACEDSESGKLTMNAGVLSVMENEVRVTLDIRYPVTCPLEKVINDAKAMVAPYGVTVTVSGGIQPVYMDKDGELIKKLVGAYKRVTGRDEEPIVIGGGTYARAMKNIVAFGPMIPGREMTEHQKNERILVGDFLLLREIYREALREICC
jgi:succinyl-diaminopimelate desuccinylase